MRLWFDNRPEGFLPLRVWIWDFTEVAKDTFKIGAEALVGDPQVNQVFWISHNPIARDVSR